MEAAEDDSNSKNNNSQVRAQCTACGTMFRAAETLCPKCGSDQRDLTGQVEEAERVSEDVNLTLLRKLKKLEFKIRLVLLSLGITIGVPIAFLVLGKADIPTTLISIAAGIAVFFISLRAVKEINEIYKLVQR
jgi:hypothetical protein